MKQIALSSKPLDVDVVVIKKTGEIKLAHPIARFFRGYNLFKYKSPGDYLEANDFDKEMALAFLHARVLPFWLRVSTPPVL